MIARTKSKTPARRKTVAAKSTATKSAAPKSAKTARAPKPQPSGDRAAIIKRMWRAADAQVQEIEMRLLQDSQAPLERERDARVLSVLAKTLRELSSLDASKQRKQTAAPADDDAVPRDIDELRRSLARKLQALVDGRTTELPGGT